MEIGSTVTLAYKGMLDDGTVFGYANADSPMVYQTGTDSVIDGFEAAVLAMNEIGEKKTITLDEHEAYGERIEGRTVRIPADQVPSGRARAGREAYLPDEKTGEPMPAVCLGVKDGYVEYDLNHPLAGKSLTFEIELLDFEAAPEGFVPAKERRKAMEQQMSAYGL